MSSSPSTRASSPKAGHPSRQTESATAQQLPAKKGQSGKEPGGNDNSREEIGGERGVKEPDSFLHGITDGNHEAGTIDSSPSPTPAREEERRQGKNEESHDREDEERRTRAPRRPQRHGTLPGEGWQEGRVGAVGGVGVDHDNEDAGRDEEAEETEERPDPLTGERGLTFGEEKRPDAPRRPQRHGTLPEGNDWEENLRSGYGAVGPAAAARSVCGEGSEGTTWSMAEEVNFRSSPTNGSHSPTRSFHSPTARRSRLVLTPDGSDSSAWSRGHTDGVESVHRWLQVRARFW